MTVEIDELVRFEMSRNLGRKLQTNIAIVNSYNPQAQGFGKLHG